MKIWVRGVSCSGKSTLAKKLSERLRITHIELDELHWLSDWQPRDTREFLELVKKQLTQESWILDGNYRKVTDVLNPNPDYIIWLNYPFYKVLSRCISRTFSRIFTGTPVCNGNKETIRNFLTIDGNMLIWVIKTYSKRKKQLQLLQSRQNNIIEIRDEADIERFIVSQNLPLHQE
jgi:adenylate kinase family enzyme